MNKPGWYLGQWLLVGAVVLGCGGSDSNNGSGTCGGAAPCGGTPDAGGNQDGSTTCNGAAPCGGTLDGTWQIDGTCVEGNLAAAMAAQANLPSACSGLFQSATPTMTGTVTFANGMETDNLTQTINASLLFTPGCLSAQAGLPVTIDATACSSVGQELMSSGDFSTASCSLAGANCACSVSAQSPPTTPQAYVVSGNTITYPGGSSPMDYCVSGTTLTVREKELGVTFVSTAHKL